jgi:hypothetical protein
LSNPDTGLQRPRLPATLLAKLAQLHASFARYEDGDQSHPWTVIATSITDMLDAYKTTDAHTTGFTPNPQSEDPGDILIDELNSLFDHWIRYQQPGTTKVSFTAARDAVIDVLNAFSELQDAAPAQQSNTAPPAPTGRCEF